MGAYRCAICDGVYDSSEVLCFEYGNNELICEGCKEVDEYHEKEKAMDNNRKR